MNLNEIVAYLTAERHRQNLTQKDVAAKIRLCQSAISGYESLDRHKDGLDWLVNWAEALGYELVVELKPKALE